MPVYDTFNRYPVFSLIGYSILKSPFLLVVLPLTNAESGKFNITIEAYGRTILCTLFSIA